MRYLHKILVKVRNASRTVLHLHVPECPGICLKVFPYDTTGGQLFASAIPLRFPSATG
jgi:hypothetical protein